MPDNLRATFQLVFNFHDYLNYMFWNSSRVTMRTRRKGWYVPGYRLLI